MSLLSQSTPERTTKRIKISRKIRPIFGTLTPILIWTALGLALRGEEDWARIASETEEPGFSALLTRVNSSSQAEAIGLKAGDFVYQIGERSVRGFEFGRREHEEVIFFCRSGGAKETAVVKPGLLGVYMTENFRPQIEFLRGEIGTPDDRWNGPAVAALAQLEADPKAAEEAWKVVKDLGYPNDELDAFVHAFCAWRLSRTIPVREAFAKIEAEFTAMPHLYAALLEDMAHASGQTDLLRKLHDLDPASSHITPTLLGAWEKFDVSPTPLRRLVSEAAKRKDRDLRHEVTIPEGEDIPKMQGRLDKLRNHESFNPGPGKYIMAKFRLPEEVRDFHYTATFHAYVYGYHERYASEIRLGVMAGVADGERFGGRTLAELAVRSTDHGETRIVNKGGHSGISREVRRLDKPIPFKGNEKEGQRSAMSRTFRVEIIRIGNEIAAYCDGVAYCHLPIDPAVSVEELQFFASGINAKVTRFELWSLKPE